ncbi:MAG: hypothetical protein AWT59_2546, partial [Candidatus Gallionella acididurans]
SSGYRFLASWAKLTKVFPCRRTLSKGMKICNTGTVDNRSREKIFQPGDTCTEPGI